MESIVTFIVSDSHFVFLPLCNSVGRISTEKIRLGRNNGFLFFFRNLWIMGRMRTGASPLQGLGDQWSPAEVPGDCHHTMILTKDSLSLTDSPKQSHWEESYLSSVWDGRYQ
jgi:hypothetical protein